MSSLDADVNIILHAEDRASPEVAAAVKNMNTSWRDHLQQVRAVGRNYELQNKSLFTTIRAVQSVGAVTSRLLSIYNSFTLTQIRLQDAARNYKDSLTDVAEATARFGEGSPEQLKAIGASRRELEAMTEAQRQAAIGYAFMTISMIADSTRIITKVIPALRAVRLLMGGGAAASAGGAVGGLGAAAGGAAAGGLAAGALKGALKAAPIAAAVMIASDVQPAYGGPNDKELPGGFDAIGPAATQIFNFFGMTTNDLVKKVNEATKGIVTFGN